MLMKEKNDEAKEAHDAKHWHNDIRHLRNIFSRRTTNRNNRNYNEHNS